MRTSTRVLGVIVLLLGLLAIANGIKGQSVVRKGKIFIEQGPKKTDYLYEYVDSNNIVHRDTVCLSSNGKAFIWKVSKNGKKYRKYLPEVTKQLKK